MMTGLMPFQPMDVASTKVTATGSSANGVLAHAAANQISTMPGAVTCRVYNSGTVIAWVKFGTDNTLAAATTDMPIPPGAVEVFSIGAKSWAAAITGGTSVDVYFTPGYGN